MPAILAYKSEGVAGFDGQSEYEMVLVVVNGFTDITGPKFLLKHFVGGKNFSRADRRQASISMM